MKQPLYTSCTPNSVWKQHLVITMQSHTRVVASPDLVILEELKPLLSGAVSAYRTDIDQTVPELNEGTSVGARVGGGREASLSGLVCIIVCRVDSDLFFGKSRSAMYRRQKLTNILIFSSPR